MIPSVEITLTYIYPPPPPCPKKGFWPLGMKRCCFKILLTVLYSYHRRFFGLIMPWGRYRILGFCQVCCQGSSLFSWCFNSDHALRPASFILLFCCKWAVILKQIKQGFTFLEASASQRVLVQNTVCSWSLFAHQPADQTRLDLEYCNSIKEVSGMKAYNYKKQNMLLKNSCNLKVVMSPCSAGEVGGAREGPAFPVRPKRHDKIF